MSIKNQLFEQCRLFVQKREETVLQIINSNKKALLSETKSSAGDKHETGRAMLQLEMEKASQQLEGIQIMKETLAKTNLEVSQKVRLGSLIITDKVGYFLCISAGQLKVEGKLFFAVSASSPIGKQLLGKEINNEIVFNGNKLIIKEVL
ncbi:3-oxoacyl-ACP synthase [Tenacibaculum sp. M341]|uniref:3-oxoacyl-ACP synthase n=1 Tax=Tenacibaculum sp. M341 TaxID=2530339 RepID=UPI001052FA88|nr:3-oxoacyl-ACP synthase [Tenacibaculum sp. M341]TCI84612.1 3-oxoacyl-ACP synthase [Tenacibaculum sp. M341]